MPSLREFWFPTLLAIVGIVPLFFAGSATGNGRRAMLTFTAFFFFLAVLSYIWGDPVRGPFANLFHPSNTQNFTFKAGLTCVYPISQLKDGIDFSRCISVSGQPIELWVRKTWWSGLYVKMTLKGPGGRPIVTFDNQKLQYSQSSLDVNYDDYAFELVGPTKAPEFQLVISKDYSSIYLNARLIGPNNMMILKNNEMDFISLDKMEQPEYKLDRIFRYPSYLYQGERD
jgi:hypothetical protein